MGLNGLHQRSALCKICTAFPDDILNEITLDILLHRRTYNEIKEHYNPLLPEGVNRLNDVNINNHRKHSDASKLARDVMVKNGEVVSAGDQLSVLYSERFKSAFSKVKVLKEIYKERLTNLSVLQKILNDKKDALHEAKFEIESFTPTSGESVEESADRLRRLKEVRSAIQGVILKLTKDVDAIHNDIQNVLIKEINSDKGLAEGSIQITQNFTMVIESRLKGFMEEIIPYYLTDLFKDSPELGKVAVGKLATMLDKHIQPMLEEQTLLKQITQAKS